MDVIDHIIESVREGLHGRLACRNPVLLAETIRAAGDGHHVEIGALHGGSAILAALVKKRFGLGGLVYTIDPLDGYYNGSKFACHAVGVKDVPVTKDTLTSNLEAFGLLDDVVIVQARSIPWPQELQDAYFTTAYIDGDHWQEAPWLDWQSVSVRTDKYVIFDDAEDDIYPAVLDAIALAASDESWELERNQGGMAVLRRV